MKLSLLSSCLLFIASVSQAAIIQLSDTTGGFIPDGSLAGLSRTLELSQPGETIESIAVELTLSGHNGLPYLGDLYLYLSDGSTLVTLLNRSGRDVDRLDGYDDIYGIRVTLTDAAATDIHLYREQVTGDNDTALGALLTGTFQPDGRDDDPLTVVTGTPRTSMLSDFNGLSAERSFTLFAADLSTGAQHQINSWGLNIVTIPEPSSALLVILAAGVFAFWRKRG